MEKRLILGIGNLLLGDEGVGIHVARYLEEHFKPDQVDIVDGGTGGFHLLEYFQNYKTVILIDATIDGQPPGTIKLLKPKYSSEYPPTLTAHDIGLKDLLDSLYLMNQQPDIWLYTISIEDLDRIGLDLTLEIINAIPRAARRIADDLTAMPESA